ncbi:putative esterase of the alpha-beta hydrolase superfamily [Pseudomonas sp. GM78]|uniref:patatin-like phospholipase family protein n=1 Tax=Pseudomonas sp. GM78 TaxID=1144337 RepID=UPI000270A291|nr:patatin-like phospholipase family protein [Pseudomonas sp. GM78]EJN22768.1 putative esterase of the alpha-beta hydrolase superfamily [Pseudomonas sp. GM78]
MAKCPFAEQRPITGTSGSYTGGVFKIVHHTTEGGSAEGAFTAFKSNRSDPHFTVDASKIYQHIDTDTAARSLRNAEGGVQTNRDRALQIEVVGFAGKPKNKATLKNLARLCRWLEQIHDVPLVWPAGLPKPAKNGKDPGGHLRSTENWAKGGHFGHCHVPENTHWDPAYTKTEVEYLMAAKFDAAGKLTNAQDPAVVALENQPMAIDGDTTFEIMADHADVGEAPTRNVQPVNVALSEQPEPAARRPESGAGLCLSGGGYRAMLFHVGSLWRLYESGQLFGLQRISSVSGGSITSAVLALAWKHLPFDGARAPFEARVVGPIRELARRTLDAEAIIGGILLPGSIGDKVAAAYDKYLFHGETLQALPDTPRFVINATNVQSGVLWRFSKPYMGDYRVGRIENPDFSIARAVAASSAFPPVLSPLTIELHPAAFKPGSGDDMQRPPFTSDVVLADGGVYDNLGLETVWKRYETVLVSDAGAKIKPEEEPKHDWPRHAYRVLDLIDNQVRSLRKHALIASYQAKPDDAGKRLGTYWGIGTPYDHYSGRALTLSCKPARTQELAGIATRLKRLDEELQERLINWGYAVTDAALRTYVDPQLNKPNAFPYPDSGV